MPASKRPLGRYRIIDECLSNHVHGPWQLEELREKIIEKLDLHDLSERQLKEDIRKMRDDPDLAYYAPIKNRKGEGYFYSDKTYRITESPLSPAELRALCEALSIMQQFKGLKFFQGAEGIIHRIEANLEQRELLEVEFDILDRYAGLENLEPIKKAIHEQKVIKIYYRAFYEEAEVPRHVHPYLLKEYNNRWFLYGYTEEYDSEGVYGLERMSVAIEETDKKYRKPDKKKIKAYFQDIIGVTNLADRKVEKVILKVKRQRANYLKTKPIHVSQQLTGREDDEHEWFSLRVKPNPELIAWILSYGPDMQVEEPASLAREVKDTLTAALEQYG